MQEINLIFGARNGEFRITAIMLNGSMFQAISNSKCLQNQWLFRLSFRPSLTLSRLSPFVIVCFELLLHL